MKCLIYDYETLSQNAFDGVVICLAALDFETNRFESDNPYTFDELLGNVKFLKFDIEEQVKKYNRKIQKSAVEWWKNKPDEVIRLMNRSKDDVSIERIYDFFVDNYPANQIKRVYTRGNDFDPVFTQSLLAIFKKRLPYKFWITRDMRTLIEGFSWGAFLESDFIVPGLEDVFAAHDPKHDVAMDVMRIQYCVRLLFCGEKESV